MKQLATLLFALMLSAAASAQNKLEAPTMAKGMTLERSSTAIKSASLTPRSNIKIDGGEHLMGFYTTDELPTFDSNGYLKLNYNGAYPIGAIFDEDILEKFIGGEITRFRFAVACDVEIKRALIYTVSTDYTVSSEPIVEIDMSDAEISVGWNDVELPEPLTIEPDTYYLIGYEYVQVSNKCPLVSDMELKTDYTSDYGFAAYGELGTSVRWHFYIGSGQLCVQAVVSGGNIVDEDICLRDLSIDQYVAKGGQLSYSFDIRNYGSLPLSSYTLNVAIDGIVVESLDTPLTLSTSYQTLSRKLTLDEELVNGKHTLTISLININGNIPTENTNDDVLETTFYTYEENVERQMHLIENFTSVQCTYCPLGHNVLETLLERYPGKYVWVAVHGIGMGYDPYYLTDGSSDYIEDFANCTSYPSATFDRYIITDNNLGITDVMAIPISYNDSYKDTAAMLIHNAVVNASKVPAFVSVDITREYDENSRELTIAVSGEGVDVASELLENDRLTIYLTEDGLVYRQLTPTGYDNAYVHNNVLRKIASAYTWGDDINWTSSSSYKNTVTLTLDDEWEADNMYIVAFISGPMAVEKEGVWYWGAAREGWINNANKAKLNDNPTGISSITATPEEGAETFYTIDGRRIATPAKGVNIVKTAKGETKKVVVK